MEEKNNMEFQSIFSAIKENMNPKNFEKEKKHMMYLWIVYIVWGSCGYRNCIYAMARRISSEKRQRYS